MIEKSISLTEDKESFQRLRKGILIISGVVALIFIVGISIAFPIPEIHETVSLVINFMQVAYGVTILALGIYTIVRSVPFCRGDSPNAKSVRLRSGFLIVLFIASLTYCATAVAGGLLEVISVPWLYYRTDLSRSW